MVAQVALARDREASDVVDRGDQSRSGVGLSGLPLRNDLALELDGVPPAAAAFSSCNAPGGVMDEIDDPA